MTIKVIKVIKQKKNNKNNNKYNLSIHNLKLLHMKIYLQELVYKVKKRIKKILLIKFNKLMIQFLKLKINMNHKKLDNRDI